MNWILLIEDIMLKCHQSIDFEFPYAVLTSRFIDYFNIDVSNEIVDFTKAFNEITKRHLKKLGMAYVDHEWITAREQPATENVDLTEEEAKEEAQQESTPQWNLMSPL